MSVHLPAIQRFRLSAFGGQGWQTLVQQHGPWAPGVRLMRQMSLMQKSALTLSVLLLPLLPAHLFEVQALVQQVEGQAMALSALGLLERTDTMLFRAETAGRRTEEDAQFIRSRTDTLRDMGLNLDQAASGIKAAITGLTLPGRNTASSAQALIDGLGAQSDLLAVIANRPLDGDGSLSNQSPYPLLMALQTSRLQLAQLLKTSAAARLDDPDSGWAIAETAASAHASLQRSSLLAKSGGLRDVERLTNHASGQVGHCARQQMSSARLGSSCMAQYLLAARSVYQARLSAFNTARTHLLSQRAMVTDRLRSVALGALLYTCVGCYLLVCAYRALKDGTQTAHQFVARIAVGDLSRAPEPQGGDELGAVIDGLGAAIHRMTDLLISADMGVQAVLHAAQQVAAGNADLAARNRASTDKVASVVEGVVRYTVQLEACRSQIRSAVSAIEALQIESARSRHQMRKLVETMGTLRSRSDEIGEIVSIIEAIAFRTNVLALNASVEANKAGDAGKGFAVVAQEVRSLALKATQSAQRIEGVVEASREHIGLGAGLAQEAEGLLCQMDVHVNQIQQSTDLVAKMTCEGEAESENILEELRHVKAGMDQNLGLVERLSQASGAMSAQSEKLQVKLSQFKVQ
jgi:methyl-accepting chemotaxis protein I, serine sensor receptor